MHLNALACAPLAGTHTADKKILLFEHLCNVPALATLACQVTKFLQYSSEVFHTESLDPSFWMATIGEAYNHVCREAPARFVGVAFGLFVLLALVFLFESDFIRWRRERNLREQGYRQLEIGDDGPTDEGLEKLYSELDSDGGGSIDREEMARCVRLLPNHKEGGICFDWTSVERLLSNHNPLSAPRGNPLRPISYGTPLAIVLPLPSSRARAARSAIKRMFGDDIDPEVYRSDHGSFQLASCGRVSILHLS